MQLGIVIVNWNVRDLLAACLRSVYSDLIQSGLSGQVVVVDNGSTDGSPEMVRRDFPATLLLTLDNPGFGAANNAGIKALGETTAVLILNPDTIVRAGTLRSLYNFLRDHPHAGVVAPSLLNPDGSLQHSGFHFPGLVQGFFDLFPLPGRLARLMDSPLNGRYPALRYRLAAAFAVDHTLGAAFMVRSAALADEQLFDESFFLYCEEIDAQWRLARKGWGVYILPTAHIVHYGGRSTSQDLSKTFVHLWHSRHKLYQRYHGGITNILMRGMVIAAMRNRLRANYQRQAQGAITIEQRAEQNSMLAEVVEIWEGKRRSNQ